MTRTPRANPTTSDEKYLAKYSTPPPSPVTPIRLGLRLALCMGHQLSRFSIATTRDVPPLGRNQRPCALHYTTPPFRPGYGEHNTRRATRTSPPGTTFEQAAEPPTRHKSSCCPLIGRTSRQERLSAATAGHVGGPPSRLELHAHLPGNPSPADPVGAARARAMQLTHKQ